MRARASVLALALAAAAGSSLGSAAEAPDELGALSLEELSNVSVSTATRREQRLDQVPAAVWVITQDDIRRSGATSIPEALRLAPGLHVARIDASTWAVSSRGFNSRFANKLLVLMDGRTLFEPSFGGVFWNVQDTVLDDVERIEVIRGPGTALWGTNAVNGIINVLTKPPAQTQGLLVASNWSPGEERASALRFGGTSPALGEWRAWVKQSVADGARVAGTDGDDHWNALRGGARLERAIGDDVLNVQAEAYRHDGSHAYYEVAPSVPAPGMEERSSGASALVRWRRSLAAGGSLIVQGYVDDISLEGFHYAAHRTTFDLDLQHDVADRGGHRVTWGASARSTRDRIPATQFVRVSPDHLREQLFGTFVQDEWSLHPGVALTAGLKLEHHEAAGSAWLPNLRLRWAVDDRQTLWAAVARAVRQPARSELTLDARAPAVLYEVPLPTGRVLPVYAEAHGNPDLGAEEMVTAEAGWRRALGASTSLDVAAYWSRYRRLSELVVTDLRCAPSGLSLALAPDCALAAQELRLIGQYQDSGRTSTAGIEATVAWQAAPSWRLVGGGSWIDEHDRHSSSVNGDLLQPRAAPLLAQLRSTVNFGPDVEWDLFARYASGIDRYVVPAYVELNTRIAWRPAPRFELALVGHDLLHRRHLEQVSELQDIAPTPVGRTVLLQLRWAR